MTQDPRIPRLAALLMEERTRDAEGFLARPSVCERAARDMLTSAAWRDVRALARMMAEEAVGERGA